jgi:hypothetical protein
LQRVKINYIDTCDKPVDDVAINCLNHGSYVWYRQDIEQRLKYINQTCAERKRSIKSGINRRGTYLYGGCLWITIRPVWLVVGGCSKECTVGSVPAVTVGQ